MDFISQVLYSFSTLLIILDPFLGLAVFSALTKGMSIKEKFREATVASGVAFSLLIIFMLTGIWLLHLLDIQFGAFKVAGGLILLMLGVQAVLGLEFTKKQTHTKVAAVVIGTPLLCGPGAMTAITVLSEKHGYLPAAIGALGATYVTWILLTYSHKIEKFVGQRVIEVVSRVMGLILSALAIQFIYNGIMLLIG
jgi:multiple antibiotic resistance protein